MGKLVSTDEAAQLLGLQRPNLQRAIREGRVKAPRLVTVGRVKVRLWSRADIAAARKALRIGRRKR